MAGDNNKPQNEAKLVLKVELIDKQFHVTFGKDVNSLLFDRALTLAKLQLDNIIIASTQPKTKIVPINTPLIKNLDDIRNRIGSQ